MLFLLRFLYLFGSILIFAFNVIRSIFRKPFVVKDLISQMVLIAINSVPLVIIVSLAVGMIFAFQFGTFLDRTVADGSRFLGGIVGVSFLLELGPVFISIVLSGRVGAAITAEIAIMKVTEQMDALYSLSVDPIQYLIVPRLLATLILFPFIVVIADFAGILGGYFIAFFNFNQPFDVFLVQFQHHAEFIDLVSGVLKSSIFGFIIVIVSSWYGVCVENNTYAISQATRNALVVNNILILIVDYVFNILFNLFFR